MKEPVGLWLTGGTGEDNRWRARDYALEMVCGPLLKLLCVICLVPFTVLFVFAAVVDNLRRWIRVRSDGRTACCSLLPRAAR